MPSPIGHSLAALAAYQGMGRSVRAPQSWRTFLCYCFAASAPDCDFLPGLLLGEPDRFHQGISHSLGMALIFAAFVAVFCRWTKGEIMWSFVLILFSLYCSHLLFDYLSVDTGLPYGIPVWWPLSGEHYLSPIAIFSDVHRGDSPKDFISWAFIQHNLWAVTLEVMILLPLVGLAGGLQRQRDRYLQGKRLSTVNGQSHCREVHSIIKRAAWKD
jgi:inner membrane protein